MRQNETITYITVAFSFIIAFAIMIMPINPKLIWIRPDLVTLLTIYWVTNVPDRIGVVFAFMVGLAFDLLTGMLFGSSALTLGIVAFLALSIRLRLRIYRPLQKFTVILLIIGGSQLIRLWIQMLVGHPPASFMYWCQSMTSALTWPLMCVVLQSYQRTLRIA